MNRRSTTDTHHDESPTPHRRAGLFLLLGAAVLLTLPLAPALAEEPVNKIRVVPPTDPGIHKAIEREFRSDKALPFDDMDVTVADGIVTLRGTVGSMLAKKRAARQAQTVRGVRSVVNLLVIPVAPNESDAEITKRATMALRTDPATDAYEVRTLAEDGVLTLDGTVDSWRERALAETVAMGVKGVRRVENEIAVATSTEPRPAAEIKAEIERALHWEVYIDDGLIEVDVQDGVAHLSGVVGSAAERRLAMAKAMTRGVQRVHADKLTVELWARTPALRKNKFQTVDDKRIENALHMAMAHDPRVLSYNVEADVDAGLVTLSGLVDNLRARRAAAQSARNTVGVVGVLNHIKVRPKEERADQAIAKDIQAAFARDPIVHENDVAVRVEDGRVRLTGVADSSFERSQADDLASRVRGVRDIRNLIQVSDYTLGYDAYVDDWYIYDHGFIALPTLQTDRSDADIRFRIETELIWSPFVEASNIDVSVKDGVATLKGSVGSWAESNFARQNAYEGGAILVRNRLSIESPEPMGQ